MPTPRPIAAKQVTPRRAQSAMERPARAAGKRLRWRLPNFSNTGTDRRCRISSTKCSKPCRLRPGKAEKSGKTSLAAAIVIYVIVVLAETRYAEATIVANDLEQAQSRVYKQICRILTCSPAFDGAVKITQRVIEFIESQSTITAVGMDYGGQAGSNSCVAVFDELWGYSSEKSARLWDEFVPPPTRKIACRLTVSYAGFEGESETLWQLVERGKKGQLIGTDLYAGDGILMHLSHTPIAPWQTDSWLAQVRQQLQANAFVRMITNQFVTSESGFVQIEWFDLCVDSKLRPVLVYEINDRGFSNVGDLFVGVFQVCVRRAH
jgi:hypothetical protein